MMKNVVGGESIYDDALGIDKGRMIECVERWKIKLSYVTINQNSITFEYRYLPKWTEDWLGINKGAKQVCCC